MNQASLYRDDESAKNLLRNLLLESRLYRQSEEFKELLEFTTKLRNVAPFNAMLLHIQKPGIQYVSSRYDWLHRFGRKINQGARPLLILFPFGPVAFVYDVADTEGDPLPNTVLNPFPVVGNMTAEKIDRLLKRLARKMIEVSNVDFGTGKAGGIMVERTSSPKEPGEKVGKVKTKYKLTFNRNHKPNQQFVTMAHELAHLFLGHLGGDEKLKVKSRIGLPRWQLEIEAESVAYLVCRRHGVKPGSQSYLSSYMGGSKPLNYPDLYAVSKAAGQVENILGIGPEEMHFGDKTPK